MVWRGADAAGVDCLNWVAGFAPLVIIVTMRLHLNVVCSPPCKA